MKSVWSQLLGHRLEITRKITSRKQNPSIVWGIVVPIYAETQSLVTSPVQYETLIGVYETDP